MGAVPLTTSKSTFSNGLFVSVSTAVLKAASITPPVAPNITPAPEDSPKGLSKSSSGNKLKLIPALLIILASSLVVSDISTSGIPFPAADWSSLPTSNFLAVQGIMDTEKIFFGSMPFFSAYQVFIIAPNICCGDLQLERFSSNSGW